MLIVGLLALPLVMPGMYWQRVVSIVCIYALLALSFDFLAHYVGLVSLGGAFFVGTGSYLTAILNTKLGLSPLVAIPAATLIGGALCTLMLLPCLPLRGVYFAIVTLMYPLFLARVIEALDILGGTDGIMGIDSFPSAWLEQYFVIIMLLLFLFAIRRLVNTDLGTRAARRKGQRSGRQGVRHGRNPLPGPGRVRRLGHRLSGRGLPGAHLHVGRDFHLCAGLLGAADCGDGHRGQRNPGRTAARLPDSGAGVGTSAGFRHPSNRVLLADSSGLYRLSKRGVDGLRPTKVSSDPKVDKNMKGEPILEVREVTKTFGGIIALNRVSFDVGEGEILGIIGPNGSGKTTVVNCITGFVKASSGRILFRGRDITGMRPHRIADMGVTRTFQIMRPYYSLPAYKNMVIPLFSPRARRTGGWRGGGRLGDRNTVGIDILEEIGFERDSYVPYKLTATLPTGYLKRLELARCLALKPELIICDEVFSGLSMSEIASMVPLIERLQMDGITLIMIEHRLRELFKVANRVMVLNFGEKLVEGPPAEVMADKRVREAYFGSESVEEVMRNA